VRSDGVRQTVELTRVAAISRRGDRKLEHCFWSSTPTTMCQQDGAGCHLAGVPVSLSFSATFPTREFPLAVNQAATLATSAKRD